MGALSHFYGAFDALICRWKGWGAAPLTSGSNQGNGDIQKLDTMHLGNGIQLAKHVVAEFLWRFFSQVKDKRKLVNKVVMQENF